MIDELTALMVLLLTFVAAWPRMRRAQMVARPSRGSRPTRGRLMAFAVGMLLATASPVRALTTCHMRFDTEGWPVLYLEARGGGVVRCDNGQEARVVLETKGIGVTFGRSKIVGGSGRFSSVADIDGIFGKYASAEAHAGMGVSAGAQVMTRGSVSLAVSGTGNGVGIGFAFGRFTIRRASTGERDARPRDGGLRDENLPPAVTTPEEGY